MATEEFIKRSILSGKQYEELPARVKASVSLADWKHRVKDHCTQRGLSWRDSMAKSACTEGEYYEDLLTYYRHNLRVSGMQLFPYHLADYVCRVLRVTPFRYNCDLLYGVMREEKSYDRIPNFTAADIVRSVGIGRNEYISIMNRCKAKKLLWRVNKAIVKEMLPTEPVDIEMQPWWMVNVVNLGETEFRQLKPEEVALCQEACRPGGLQVQEVGPAALQPLYKRGLVYLDVPINPTDHVSIPPLEGFVSNKDSETNKDKGDPLEAVLYAVFVATSARASVAELATMLSVDQPKLQAAVSIACRLGFAQRLPQGNQGDETASPSAEHAADKGLDVGSEVAASSPEASAGDLPAAASKSLEAAATAAAESEDGQAIALVVDSEVTSYLMMGALSPGLKRHSVTLFEGGRVTGSHVILELIRELHTSFEAAQQFEGEMQRLAGYARALAIALECIRTSAGNRPIELLRKESLAGLAPAAASRVLSHAYAAVVPIAPLPSPPLPLAPSRPGPTNFGATVEASTPWLQLALYRAARSGPASLVLLCGQLFWRLPPQLAGCTHALLWPWDANAVRAQSVPVVVGYKFLLFSLNEHLSRTAVVVQPLVIPAGASPDDLPMVDVALPLVHSEDLSQTSGFDPRSGEKSSLTLPSGVADAMQTMGLNHSIGSIRLLQVAETRNEDLHNAEEPRLSGVWVPLTLQLGLPLQPDVLCEAACRQAQEAGFLESEACKQHAHGQALLQKRLFALISEFGACTNCLAPAVDRPEEPLGYVDLPIHNLLVEEGEIRRLDFGDYLQGSVGALYVD